MILVTVGTHSQGFSRLVRAMDEIAGRIEEEVVMQIGASSYVPRKARHFEFSGQEEMERLNREARVVVTHAGAGSIITGLKWGKPLIVMPRLAKHGEVIDDHQLELAEALSRAGKVFAVHDGKELGEALERAGARLSSTATGRGRLVAALRRYVDELEASPPAASPEAQAQGETG